MSFQFTWSTVGGANEARRKDAVEQRDEADKVRAVQLDAALAAYLGVLRTWRPASLGVPELASVARCPIGVTRSPMRRTPSGEFIIFLLALPAFLSPLILMPLPDAWFPLPAAGRALAALCMYPRLWAGVATVVAGLWVTRAQASRTRKALGALIALLAWIPAWHTANIMGAWERF